MEIRKRSNGDVISASQFKALYPNTSFPKPMTAEVYESFGYDVVLQGPQATVTGPYGVSTRSGVEEKDGKWYSKFVAGPVFANADEEAAYKADVDARQARTVRADRDRKLAECDWTQANDSPLKAASAWTTYRQSLRMYQDSLASHIL